MVSVGFTLFSCSPCTQLEASPRNTRVLFSTRTKLPGGLGGPGGGFSNHRHSGKATTATTTKNPPPGVQKPPGNSVRVENHGKSYPSYFWGMPLSKRRDYRSSIPDVRRSPVGVKKCVESMLEIEKCKILDAEADN